jgi:protein gp37
MKYWTHTHNPLRGCTKISPGCAECWAEKLTARLAAAGHDVGETISKGKWTGRVQLREDCIPMKLNQLKTGAIIAMCWLSDLFHDAVPSSFIQAQLRESNRQARMRWAAGLPRHTYLYLTKRYERMVDELIASKLDPPGHLFGASVCTEAEMDDATIAFSRLPRELSSWLSMEPLLENPLMTIGQHSERPPIWKWIVLGGMSNGREVDPRYVREVIDWCVKHETPLLFKQWGGNNYQQPPIIDGESYLFTPEGTLTRGADNKWRWSA